MTDLDKLIQMASEETVSDELLAAYIDGNTTEEENDFIESALPQEDIREIADIVADSHSFEDQLHFYDGDYGFWELGIPPALEYHDDKQSEISLPKYENLFPRETNENFEKDIDSCTPTTFEEDESFENNEFTDTDMNELFDDNDI